MRVLMLSWEYPLHIVGGLGRHVADLLPSLAAQGVEVHLLTPRWAGGKNEEKGGEETIHRIDPLTVERGSLFATAWQTNLALEEHAAALQKRRPFDIIHAHDWLVGFAACSLKRRYKILLLATIHATERGQGHGLHNDLQRAINDVEWWLTYEAWRVLCASEFMAQEVKGFFNVPADKVDVVPNGVDGERFCRLEGEDLTAFRAQFATPQEKMILHVGRMVQEKGLHLLVQAAPQVLAQHKAKFVVVGTGDLPEWAQMRVENAYRMMKEGYGWGQIARRTTEIYKRVVEEREVSDW